MHRVPAQRVRFIELMYERGLQNAFEGKYAIAISPAANFFDHTAHQYLREICDGLKMPFPEGFSDSMIDILNPERDEWKNNLSCFFDEFVYHVPNKVPLDATIKPLVKSDFGYEPAGISETPKTGAKRLVVVTDARYEEGMNAPIART